MYIYSIPGTKVSGTWRIEPFMQVIHLFISGVSFLKFRSTLNDWNYYYSFFFYSSSSSPWLSAMHSLLLMTLQNCEHDHRPYLQCPVYQQVPVVDFILVRAYRHLAPLLHWHLHVRPCQGVKVAPVVRQALPARQPRQPACHWVKRVKMFRSAYDVDPWPSTSFWTRPTTVGRSTRLLRGFDYQKMV